MPEPERPTTAPPHWRWLSPLEEKILQAVSAEEWTTAEEVARRVGEGYGPEFRGLMRNLAERGILTSCQGKGYKLSLAP